MCVEKETYLVTKTNVCSKKIRSGDAKGIDPKIEYTD